jgi:stage V sporulation protein AE
MARAALEEVARQIGGRCISRSAGNPTPLSGPQLVRLIKESACDPVLVMFDDCGSWREGRGEQALRYVARHPDIEVLGAVAVASDQYREPGVPVDLALDRNGKIVKHAVDKHGVEHQNEPLLIHGDTVSVLNDLQIPIVVGVGDVGKMGYRDGADRGAPITAKAVQLILEEHGYESAGDNPDHLSP